MKLILERSDALSALTRVTGVVARNSNVAILNNVLITASDNRVTFRATDLDMEATSECGAEISEAGSLTVDANKLREVVQASAQGSQIGVELKDDGRLHVSSGRSRFKLPVLPADSFPQIPDDKWDVTFVIPAEILADAFERTIFAVGTDMAMPALGGVMLEIRDGKLTTAATNRYRVSRIQYNAPKGSTKMPPVIVPAKYVQQIIKAANDAQDATVSVSKGKVRVVTELGSLVGKTLDYDALDYNRLIPAEYDSTALIDKATFIAAAKRAAIAGDVDKNGTGIRLAFTKGMLTITGRNHDGEALDEIEIDYDGPEFSCGSGVQYLLDAVTNVEGETVSVGFGEKISLLGVWSDTDDASLQLVGKRLVGQH